MQQSKNELRLDFLLCDQENPVSRTKQLNGFILNFKPWLQTILAVRKSFRFTYLICNAQRRNVFLYWVCCARIKEQSNFKQEYGILYYIIEMDIAFGPDNHLNTFLIVWKCFFILLPGQFANKQYLVYARNPFFKRLNRHSKPNTNSFCKKLRNV